LSGKSYRQSNKSSKYIEAIIKFIPVNVNIYKKDNVIKKDNGKDKLPGQIPYLKFQIPYLG